MRKYLNSKIELELLDLDYNLKLFNKLKENGNLNNLIIEFMKENLEKELTYRKALVWKFGIMEIFMRDGG